MLKRTLSLLVLLLVAASAVAEAPRTLSVQGVLTDPGGEPLDDGFYTVSFLLFDAPGEGALLWEEMLSVEQTGGVFNSVLGLVQYLDPAFFDQELYLGMNLYSEPMMEPLIRLTASAYAHRAAVADSVVGGGGADNDWLIAGDDIFHDPGRVYIGTNPAAAPLFTRPMEEKGTKGMADREPSASKLTIIGNNEGLLVKLTEVDANSDRRSGVFSTRTRSQANHGTDFGVVETNTAITGYNEWGDSYTYGVAGYTWFDSPHTAGVLGSLWNGDLWGALGYLDANYLAWGFYTPYNIHAGGTASLGGLNMATGASAGYILTSDASGNATWQTPSGGADSDWTIVGDDLYHAPDGTVAIGSNDPAPFLTGVATLQVEDEFWPAIVLDKTSAPFRRWSIFQEGISGELQFGSNANTGVFPNAAFRLTEDGRVGIGGDITNANLHVKGGNGDVDATSGDLDIGLGVYRFRVGVHTSGAQAGEVNVRARTTNETGKLDLGVDDHDVLRIYDSRVEVLDPSGTSMIEMQAFSDMNNGAFANFYSTLHRTPTIVMDAQEGGSEGAVIRLRNAAGVTTVELDADYAGSGAGRVKTTVLEITGGADLSEQFDVGEGPSAIEPGMVVCIDPERPGRLKISDGAYDRRVAGVLSGAGGVNTGMLMGQRGSEADGDMPVALAGRVYVWADAAGGAIVPGDLLTTSDTPGHAMRVGDGNHAGGAVLGKAMTGLAAGKGLVLVLVSLQ